jgi:hypothetical protein
MLKKSFIHNPRKLVRGFVSERRRASIRETSKRFLDIL